MIALQGRPICGGIVFGRIFMFEKANEKFRAIMLMTSTENLNVLTMRAERR